MRTITATTIAISAKEANTLAPSAAVAGQRSPWHSPVPYLFGGLAAMLGLIAFALLILACSYWRLTGQMENERSDSENRDIESGGSAEKDDAAESADKAPNVYEEKIVVIMAGDDNPTFLATPVFAKVSSFGCGNGKDVENSEGGKGEKENSDEKVKKEVLVVISNDDHHHHHDHQASDHDENSQERRVLEETQVPNQ